MRALSLWVVFSLIGCGGPAPLLRQPTPHPFTSPEPGLRVGVAEIDITPPPGLSLFGHGPEGRISVGWRTRLHCQAFVVAKGEELVALVPCDLAAISMLLQREVAHALAHDRIPIAASRLMLMATHTHAGPAHYFGSSSYSAAFSSRAHGFDPEVAAWLAHRIAQVVGDAYRDLEPAVVGWKAACVGGLTRNRSFDAFLRNQHLRGRLAQVQDLGLRTAVGEPAAPAQGPLPPPRPAPPAPGAEQTPTPPSAPLDAGETRVPAAGAQAPSDDDPAPDALAAAQAPPAPPQLTVEQARPQTGGLVQDPDTIRGLVRAPGSAVGSSPRACMAAADWGDDPGAAVDPTLTVLEVRAPGGRVKGVLVVFGMHPTAVPNTNDVYHGDVFGYARRALARRWVHRTGTDAPIIGIANGIEGDASPAWQEQSHWESRRIGFALADRIDATLEGRLPPAVFGVETDASPLRVAYRELSLPGARASTQGDHRLCGEPELGAAAAGGAEDGPTAFRIISAFNEGVSAPGRCPGGRCGCQGPKLTLVPPGGRPEGDGRAFPSVVPISLVRLGGLVIASSPAELTTVSGDRAVRGIHAALAGDAEPVHVAMTGLTNGYLQYVTTHEEYRLQHYEGASTLYGHHSCEFFTNQFRCLARSVRSGDGAPSGQAPSGQAPAACFPDQRPVDVIGPVPHDGGSRVDRMPPPAAGDEGAFEPELRLTPYEEHGHRGVEITWLGEPPGFLRNPGNLRVDALGCDQDSCDEPVDDDGGMNMEVRYEWDRRTGTTRWRARWFPELGSTRDAACRYYQLRVRASAQLRSDRFQGDPSTCAGGSR